MGLRPEYGIAELLPQSGLGHCRDNCGDVPQPLPKICARKHYCSIKPTKRPVITTGTKKGQHPSPATVKRMLREHDEQAAALTTTRPLRPLSLLCTVGQR